MSALWVLWSRVAYRIIALWALRSSVAYTMSALWVLMSSVSYITSALWGLVWLAVWVLYEFWELRFHLISPGSSVTSTSVLQLASGFIDSSTGGTTKLLLTGSHRPWPKLYVVLRRQSRTRHGSLTRQPQKVSDLNPKWPPLRKCTSLEDLQ